MNCVTNPGWEDGSIASDEPAQDNAGDFQECAIEEDEADWMFCDDGWDPVQELKSHCDVGRLSGMSVSVENQR